MDRPASRSQRNKAGKKGQLTELSERALSLMQEVDVVTDCDEAAKILHRWKTRGVSLRAVAAIFALAADNRMEELDHSSTQPYDRSVERLVRMVMRKYRPLLHQLRQVVVWIQPLLDMYDVYPCNLYEHKKQKVPLGDYLLDCLAQLSQCKDSDAPLWAERLGFLRCMALLGQVRRLDKIPPPLSLRLPSDAQVWSLLHRRPRPGIPGSDAYAQAIFCLRELFRLCGIRDRGPRGHRFYWQEACQLFNNKTLWALAYYFSWLSLGLALYGPITFLAHDLSEGAFSGIDTIIWRFVDLDVEKLCRSAYERYYNKALCDPFDFGGVLEGLASTSFSSSSPHVELPPEDFLWVCFDVAPFRPFTPKGLHLLYDRFKQRTSEEQRQQLLQAIRTLLPHSKHP